MKGIRALALDVDGVLTDGNVWWGDQGQEFKRISFRDIMGLAQARRAGLAIGLISGEGGPFLERLGTKLQASRVFADCRDKASALRDFAAALGLPPAAICFMGDDINDLGAMEIAGWSACPADAHPKVLASSKWVMLARGGCGAVRELTDRLLEGEAN